MNFKRRKRLLECFERVEGMCCGDFVLDRNVGFIKLLILPAPWKTKIAHQEPPQRQEFRRLDIVRHAVAQTS